MKFLVSIFFLISTSCLVAQQSVTFFFDTNKYVLNKVELSKLNKWLLDNKTSKIVSITGSTDEVGTTGYNDTLSQKRVNFIFSQIKGKIAIRNDFKTISLGENFQEKTSKSLNRKAVIHYILEKDIPRENEILGIKPKLESLNTKSNEIIPIEEEDMHFPEGATLEKKIELSRPGTLIVLPEIQFYVNTFGIMPTSKRAVDELLYVLDKNPKLRIEIQGHICCANNDNRNLSLDRAKQVRRVLVSNGIRQDRILVKGFGVSKPKFPIPEADELKALANRRVEIMILNQLDK